MCIHHVYKRSFFHVYIIQAVVFLKKNNICSLQLKFMKVIIRFLPKFFKEIPVAKVSAIRLSCLQTPASFYVNSNFFFLFNSIYYAIETNLLLSDSTILKC